MKALMRKGPGQMALIDMDKPEAGKGEVRIKVSAAGICGSDVHRFHDPDSRWDSLVMGHEFSGIVDALGDGVSTVEMGTQVAIAPLIPCMRCNYCQCGLYSQCNGYSFIGSRRNGAFAEYTIVPAVNLIMLPEGLSVEKAVFLEPLTVVLHPLMTLTNQMGKIDTAVVTGLGTIGLLAVQVFRWMGVRTIIASDIIQDKIDLACSLGASIGINALKTELHSVTDPLGGAQIIFEASGTGTGKKNAIRAAASSGTVLLVGTTPQDVLIEAPLFERVTRKEISIKGSWMNYSAPWPGTEWTTGTWLLAQGQIDTDSLITHRFQLNCGLKAFDLIRDKSEPFIKILFKDY